MKKFLKFLLYAGAVVCCLAGLWTIHVAIVNFNKTPYQDRAQVRVLETIYICLSFTPAIMLALGLKTKTQHWVVIGIVEAFVIAVAVFGVLVLIVTMRGGE